MLFPFFHLDMKSEKCQPYLVCRDFKFQILLKTFEEVETISFSKKPPKQKLFET